ncbi:hypothetical protein GON26_11270 [Flavobacterium sp. GA093]|uniref:Uncharacterized protein n=1 Tax=Flavobacterium hydrocarbonoxydans TaxID=2683249 RepID=A0A6I4NKN8_9FLAO|nr:hypothetical protein [Flavobacterium hydrocarbonoxydans]MWB94950.1 hypothetical protein [Flavobacterium hydrocarbonoxydans]
MTIKQIEAIGNFLTYYRTDLIYINQFQKFKAGKISPEEYIQKNPGSFYSFLIEYRVVRNFPKGTVNKLLYETSLWIKSSESNNVDLFAEKLAETVTNKKVMASMASKILFLNNPWEIIPMDSLARKTLNQKENKYSVYKNKLTGFGNENELIFENSLNYTNSLTNIIHTEFNDLKDLKLICKNRIIDKVLWTMGK